VTTCSPSFFGIRKSRITTSGECLVGRGVKPPHRPAARLRKAYIAATSWKSRIFSSPSTRSSCFQPNLLSTMCASSRPRRAAHESIGKRTTTLVPLPAVLRISSSAPRFFARARILANPNPPPLDRPLAMPEPLSLILSTRFGGFHRRLTLMTVGWAWRRALLIAS